MSELTNTLTALYKTAPDAIQDLLATKDLQERLAAIATRHNIHPNQGILFENEVALTLLGGTPPEQFGRTLQKEIGFTDEQIQALVADLNAEIFEPVRDEFLKIQNDYHDIDPDAPTSPQPTIEHSSLSGVADRLTVPTKNEREEKELPKAADPYREQID